MKLQILEENQKIISNKEKIITNHSISLYNLLSSIVVLGYSKIRIGRKADEDIYF